MSDRAESLVVTEITLYQIVLIDIPAAETELNNYVAHHPGMGYHQTVPIITSDFYIKGGTVKQKNVEVLFTSLQSLTDSPGCILCSFVPQAATGQTA